MWSDEMLIAPYVFYKNGLFIVSMKEIVRLGRGMNFLNLKTFVVTNFIAFCAAGIIFHCFRCLYMRTMEQMVLRPMLCC
jgi:hypothetical protein